MIDIRDLTPQELEKFLHVQALVDRQQAEAAKVRDLRRYYDGDHPVLLTQRQQEFLGPLLNPTQPYRVPGQAKVDRTTDKNASETEYDFGFSHNLLKIIIDTLAERLVVSGITVNGASIDDIPAGDDEEATADPNAEAAGILWRWWEENAMDEQEMLLYLRTMRDSTSYVMVDYDNEEQRPRIVLHEADDETQGITYHRDPSDSSHVLFANRYWWTYDPLNPGETGIERKTTYLDSEIRKYKRGGGSNPQWEPHMDTGDTVWPLPWVDTQGQPLGVLATQFQNPGGSEIEQLVGLQNLLNKSWLDLIAAADVSGFPLLVNEFDYDVWQATGGENAPKDDDNLTGDDENRIGPGRAFETPGKVKRIDAADLTKMLETIWGIVQAMSGVSRTPSYYLRPQGGANVPSGEALKQLEAGLVSRAKKRQKAFGRSWSEVLQLAWRVADTFGPSLPQLDEMSIELQWADANVRNEATEATVAEAHDRLEVPKDAVWQKLGYTPEQIAEFKRNSADERAADIALIAGAVQAQQTREQPQVDPQLNGRA